MPAEPRTAFLTALRNRLGSYSRIGNSYSLYELEGSRTRVYVRYSKMHDRRQTFFGLRLAELKQLEGHRSFIAFLWDEQVEPLLLPFQDFEDVLSEARPAADGQLKVQVYVRDDSSELYVARMGRFKVDSYFGWAGIEFNLSRHESSSNLTHSQVQSLLGSIGTAKHFDIWIPLSDRYRLDWSVCKPFQCVAQFPNPEGSASFIVREIDVVWLERGSGKVKSLFEVEHSTTIYSGLLRLNDAHLTMPSISSLGIVANEERRSVFARHLRRPTFIASGLDTVCSFLDYRDVAEWHVRMVNQESNDEN